MTEAKKENGMDEPRAVFTTGPLTLEVFDGWAALSQNGAQIDLDDADLDWLDDVLAKRRNDSRSEVVSDA